MKYEDLCWFLFIFADDAQFFSLELEAFLYCQNTHTIAAIICFIDDLNLILSVTNSFLANYYFLEVRMWQVFKRESYSGEETIVFLLSGGGVFLWSTIFLRSFYQDFFSGLFSGLFLRTFSQDFFSRVFLRSFSQEFFSGIFLRSFSQELFSGVFIRSFS